MKPSNGGEFDTFVEIGIAWDAGVGVCGSVPVCDWVAPAMREVASTSIRADRTERAKEEMNMATEGSQPLCWNKSGI